MQQGLKSLKEKADHQGNSLNKAIHKTNFNLMLQTKPSILIGIGTFLCIHF